MATTVELTDGGYLQIAAASNGTESIQKYDAGGNAVGSAYSAPTSATIAALAGGGYAVAFLVSYQVTDVETVFFSSAAQATATVYEPGSSYTLAASPGGGLVEATHPSAGYGGQPPSHVFYFDTAGHLALPDMQVWSNAAPVASVTSGGTYQISWSDNVGSLGFSIDPADPVAPTPPPAPGVSLIDDVGPVTGTFGSGVSTDDANPTLRVAVSEPGRIYVNSSSYGSGNFVGYAVTAADVAPGYVDIASAGGQGAHSLQIAEAGTDGVIGASTAFTFTVDQTPAPAPTILWTLDDVGSVQRVVTSGGATDDSAPVVLVGFNPATNYQTQNVAAGDHVQLVVDGAAVGSPVTVTADDVAKGYVEVAAPTLAAGGHSLTATVIDAAGNVGAASAPFTLTIQPDNGTAPPPPTGALPEGRTIMLPDGGFVTSWQAPAGSADPGFHVQKYDGAGHAVGPEATVPSLANLVALPDGGYMAVLTQSGYGGSSMDLLAFNAAGQQISDHTGFIGGSVTASVAGDVLVVSEMPRGYNQGLGKAELSVLQTNGQPIYYDLQFFADARPTVTVNGDGDYVLNWTVNGSARTDVIDPRNLPDLTPPPAPTITEYIDGAYVPPGQAVDGDPTLRISVAEQGYVYWGVSGLAGGAITSAIPVTAADVARGYVELQAPVFPGVSSETFSAVAANAMGVNSLTTSTYTYTISQSPAPIVAAGPSVTLSASAGWTSAAVLSNHALAVVGAQDGGYGSHVGAEQTYDASGAETASAALMGYAGPGQTLTPQLTALAYGYYQVNYAGSTDYEVYNGSDQRVFVHNAYTSQTAAVTPLAGGGYVETDPNANVFAVFDAHDNALAWNSYVSGSPGDPAVHALADGDFVFTYAGSREIESYDASGHLVAATSWGAPVENYATGFASLGQSGFLGAWIGTDFTPGPNSGQTAILIEPFLNDGSTITRTIVLAQDLDPWHTQFNLQSHADGSVAILWSQGGGVFGAEYGNGGLSDVHAAVAGDLTHMAVTELPQDKVGLAWLQDGQVWAEIFDPATGDVQRAALGANTTGDPTSIHLLATASGGLAASWRSGGGYEAAVLDSSGHASALTALPGDFLGVDSQGHAVTLHDVSGTPVLQAYALSDGLFWAA